MFYTVICISFYNKNVKTNQTLLLHLVLHRSQLLPHTAPREWSIGNAGLWMLIQLQTLWLFFKSHKGPRAVPWTGQMLTKFPFNSLHLSKRLREQDHRPRFPASRDGSNNLCGVLPSDQVLVRALLRFTFTTAHVKQCYFHLTAEKTGLRSFL